MLISVNICLYNSTKYIKETLDSVFQQTYQNFEIIAVDDGSSDRTFEFIRDNYNDKRLKLYKQTNHGLSYTRNRCAELSSGEYLAFLDHDDVWVKNKLEKQVDAIKKHYATPGLVFGDIQIIDFNGKKGAIKRISENVYKLTNNCFETILRAKSNFIGLSGVLMKKEIWDKGTAHFNLSYKMAEEYDVWLEVAFSNPVYIYIKDILFYYRIHGDNFTLKEPELQFSEPIEILKQWLLRKDHNYHSIVKKNISRYYLQWAHWYIADKNRKAYKTLQKSLEYNKFDLRVWWGYLKAFIRMQ